MYPISHHYSCSSHLISSIIFSFSSHLIIFFMGHACLLARINCEIALPLPTQLFFVEKQTNEDLLLRQIRPSVCHECALCSNADSFRSRSLMACLKAYFL